MIDTLRSLCSYGILNDSVHSWHSDSGRLGVPVYFRGFIFAASLNCKQWFTTKMKHAKNFRNYGTRQNLSCQGVSLEVAIKKMVVFIPLMFIE